MDTLTVISEELSVFISVTALLPAYLAYSLTIKAEAVCSSKMSLKLNWFTDCHI
jgi:hypothetical protein